MKDPNRVKAGKKAKRKGNNNERDLSKKLQEWWGHGVFVRTPSSGGWATADTRGSFRACGDIMTTATDWPFICEAKKDESWDLDKLLHNDKCVVYSWLEQANREAKEANAVPLLILARNRVPAVAVCDLFLFNKQFGTLWHDRLMEFVHYQFFGRDGAVGGLILVPLSSFFQLDPALFGRRIPEVQKALDELTEIAQEISGKDY